MSEEIYYKVFYKTNTVSFWETCRDLDAVSQFLKDREDKLSGVHIEVHQKHGWKEVELKELARLKEKYEPQSKNVENE